LTDTFHALETWPPAAQENVSVSLGARKGAVADTMQRSMNTDVPSGAVSHNGSVAHRHAAGA
jgi:hypothetical protein